MGPTGGVIEAPLGRLSLHVPPGAIQEQVNLGLVLGRRAMLSVLPPKGTSVSDNIVEMTQLRPSDTAIEFPLTVTVSIRMQYTDGDLAMARGEPKRLVIGRVRKQDWEVLPTRLDAVARSLTAEIGFACECTYAVLVLPRDARSPLIPTVVPPTQPPGAPLWQRPVVWAALGAVVVVLIATLGWWRRWLSRGLPQRRGR